MKGGTGELSYVGAFGYASSLEACFCNTGQIQIAPNIILPLERLNFLTIRRPKQLKKTIFFCTTPLEVDFNKSIISV